ncbi:MAG: type II secretion system protein [Planctomycetota bacterium]
MSGTRSRARRDFTLIELLVVIAILSALAAGAIAAYDGAGTNAITSVDMNNQSEVRRLLGAFFATHDGTYPDGWDSLLSAGAAGLSGGTAGSTDADAGGTLFYRGEGGDAGSGTGDPSRGVFGQLRGWSPGAGFRKLTTYVLADEQRESLVRVDIGKVYDHDTSVLDCNESTAAATARTLAAGERVCIVDPSTSLGASIYADLGQTVDATPTDLSDDTFVLVVFGLGGRNDLIGARSAGLAEAVYTEGAGQGFYGRPLVVFRLPKGVYAEPQLVGVLDSEGDTIAVNKQKLAANQ